ncbi:MAG: hypothetical protein LIP77_10010 [Planctomycetes bacterium]|nr:hypothetical protein [Planctomycetota bacterium]
MPEFWNWNYLFLLALAGILVYVWRTTRKPTVENAAGLVRRRQYGKAEAMLRPLADGGDAKAMLLLGTTLLLKGEIPAGLEAMEASAKKGNLEANAALAGVYAEGKYVPRDLDAARRYLLPLAEAGNVRMMRQYGLWSMEVEDYAAAATWLKEARRFGDAEADNDLAHLRLMKAGKIPNSHRPPVEVWREEADALFVPADSRERARTGDGERAFRELLDEIETTVVTGCGSAGRLDYPTVFSALGALAGFGCQTAVREGLIARNKLVERNAFAIADCSDGRKFYFGDVLNQPLLEYRQSVYGIISEAVKQAGGGVLPDREDVVRAVARSMGTKNFGVLTVHRRYQPKELPLNSLKRFWPEMSAAIRAREEDGPPYYAAVDPLETGWIFAAVAARLILGKKGSLPAETAGAIVIEAAVAMSKIAPGLLSGGQGGGKKSGKPL